MKNLDLHRQTEHKRIRRGFRANPAVISRIDAVKHPAGQAPVD
ncbi:MAG: hypothetical protein WBO73_06115 [Gammaproteobacteria bacterium]